MRFTILCLSLVLCCSHALAQPWADLQLTFALDGEARQPEKVSVAVDPNCANFEVMTEDLIVNKTNKGIKNIFVFVDAKTSTLDKKEIHPDLAAVPAAMPVLDNVNCTFVPHAFFVRVGQTIDVKNSDAASHNANFGFANNNAPNMMIPSKSSKQFLIATDEPGLCKVECNIHKWMNAYLIVMDHPYMAISDENGLVKIEKLPANKELTFRIFHESFTGALSEMNVGGKAEKLTRGGRIKWTLKPGMNDLGQAKIDAKTFK